MGIYDDRKELEQTLLPCPFCGSDGKAIMLTDKPGWGNGALHHAHCLECFCYGPLAREIVVAKDLWNRRKA
jgi:hypothetical protein